MSASVISIDNTNSCGFLDVIIGPMFSGKTNYLLKELTIFSIMGASVLYINHSLDTRSDNFSTHNPLIKETEYIDFIKTDDLKSFENLCDNYIVIAIDEAQFFSGLKEFVLNLVEKKGKRVIVAGLSGNFKRESFGEIPHLISYCDRITKLSSFCQTCSINKKIKEAHFSHKIINSDVTISVGGKSDYIPVCRECYINFQS
jgi:thymidine kinase